MGSDLEEKRRQQAIDEQMTDASYVTLASFFFGWFGPIPQLARELARRRNAKRLIAKCSKCGGAVAPMDAHCRHCGIEFTRPAPPGASA